MAYDGTGYSEAPAAYLAVRSRGFSPPFRLNRKGRDVIMTQPRVYTRWDPIEIRFWGQVEKTETCWLWSGKLTEKGYGRRIGHQRRLYYPHQLAYIFEVGPIPDGLVIDHLCRVRNCVNPAHLEPVTARENTRRGTDARWNEDCPNGHPPVHRTTLPSGKNICKECRRISDRRRDERQKERRRAAARARYAAKVRQKREAA